MMLAAAGRRFERQRSGQHAKRKHEAKNFGTAEVDYIYDQPPRELLDGLLRQYVTSQIYHAVIESSAAEQAARMTAMDCGDQQRFGDDRFADAHYEQRAAGCYHKRKLSRLSSGAAAL